MLDSLEDRLPPATLTVNTLSDSTGGSQLSLRDAILAVDNGSYSGPASGQVTGTFGSNDTIIFQSGLNGNLSLTTASGPFLISKDVTITADSTLNPITVTGHTQTGVFNITSAATATIAGLTIAQGKDAANVFGGINVQAGGALTIQGCTFISNQSTGVGGGAILNAGTLTVTNSTFNNNSGVVGGAIDNLGGATATLINCTISGNQATTSSGSAGGVANAGSLTLLNTIIAQNTTAGSNPDVAGAFSSFGHNLIGNATGAAGLTNGSNGDQVSNAAPFTGDLTSGLNTIANLSSTAGLAVGQLVTDSAGGIPAGTVIALLGPHTITLSRVATSTNAADTFISSIFANLGPLQNNGGGIKTMAPRPMSPAIDAGVDSDSVLTVPTADSRGVSRPQAGTVDIGAFEASQLLVTDLNDAGAGSLRDALTQSNSTPGTVVIDFQPGLTGTISLTTGRLEIIHDDWIRGPGRSHITVDGNLNYWCFGVNSQYISAGNLHTAICGLTMTRGHQTQGISDGRGGAISYRNGFPNDYLLTVKDCVIENSVGDGIYAEDRLSVINCQITNNSGHGINFNGDGLDVCNSWIAGNTAHGINADDNAVLTNTTLSGNGDHGIRNGDHNELLTNCTVTGNHSGVEVSMDDIGLYTNCTIIGNITEDAITVVGPPPQNTGNMIFANSIVGTMLVQWGIFTSQGNNIFANGFPGTPLSSDVVAPGISSSSVNSGGSLPSGTYYYVVGAVTAAGTLTSSEWKVSVGSNNSKVTLNWTAPLGVPGVTGYQIFRGTTLGGEKLIATVAAGATSFIDTGAAGSTSVSLLLNALADNGGPAPTMAPTAAGSVYTRNKANPAVAPFLDECGYARNPVLPGIGAFEAPSGTPNTVSLSPATLPGTDQGLHYSQTFAATGGTGTGYLFGITAGALPPGLALTLGGGLAGTANTAGTFTFTVTAFDNAGDFGSKNYTLNVSPLPSITTSSLPDAIENTAYSKAIQTSGGTAPFTWSYTGTLPGGITFDTSTGTFVGTPDAASAGTYSNIQVTVTDTYGKSATQTYSLTVHWVIGLSPALPADTVNIAYNQSQNITGGSGTYSGLNVTGLPSGLSASLSGAQLTISGTPTVTGTFPLSITLHDNTSNSDSTVASESLTINAALTITTSSLPNGNENMAYDQTIATTGGTGPLTFSLSAGTLPAGLGLDSATGVISGTPSVGSAGSYPFTVSVTDAAGAIASQTYNVDISAVGLGSLSFNQWTINKTGFFGTIAVSTGAGGCTLSTISGKLPTGMTDSLNGTLVTFTGEPTVAGTYNFTLKLTDGLGVTATRTYTIVINPATSVVWTGLGADANWMTPSNWVGGAAPLAGNTLVFGNGAAQKTANNNFPSGTKFAAISFADGGYTITGNDVKLSKGINSTSTAGGPDTVALNVALTATEKFNIAGTTVIDVTGTISGAKFGITKTGVGPLAFDSPTGNTYTGLTTVSGGTLLLNTSNQIVDTASVAVTAGAFLDLNGHDETISNLRLTGGTVNTGAGTLTLSGMVTSKAAASSAAINGKLNLIALTPTLNVGNGTAANDLVIAASISAGSLTKLGTGTLILSGDNSSYAGTTTVSRGVLDVPNVAALGNGPVLALSHTTLQLDGDGLLFGNALTLTKATLKNLAGSNTWAGTIADTGTSTVNVSAGTLTIDGGISGAGGLTKSGASTLILPSANTYGGFTTVSAGVLDVQTPAALGSNAAVTVAGPGTLQIDGAGLDFNKTLSLSGTLSNLNGSNTWSGKISARGTSSTINLGAGHSLTLSGVIGGAGKLTQNGAGELIVSALNTYTGNVAVTGGTLSGGGQIGDVTVGSGATLAPSTTSTQIFNTGNVTFSAGSTFAVALNGTTAGTSYDQLNVTGKVNLAGATLNVNLAFTPAIGTAFTLIQHDGTDTVIGTFAGLAQGATFVLNGMTFQISYVGGTGNDVVLTRTA